MWFPSSVQTLTPTTNILISPPSPVSPLFPPPESLNHISLSTRRRRISPATQLPESQTSKWVNLHLPINLTMSPVLCSQSVILAAAMAVSGAVVLLSIGRQKIFPATHLPETEIPTSPNPSLRSCLSNGGRKKEKKRLRVRFSETVKVVVMEGRKPNRCRSELSGVDRRMPENRVALYHGILRDRVHVHRMVCS